MSSNLSMTMEELILFCFEYFPQNKNNLQGRKDWQLPTTTSVLPVLQQKVGELENDTETKAWSLTEEPLYCQKPVSEYEKK